MQTNIQMLKMLKRTSENMATGNLNIKKNAMIMLYPDFTWRITNIT